MVNIRGGSSRMASYADQWAFNLTLGSGLNKKESQKQEWDRWSVRSNFSLQLGTPALAEEISALFAPQSIYYPTGFWLRGLYAQRDSESLSFKIGPGLSMNNLFDSPAYGYYINSTINNTLNLQVPGLPLDPYNSLGASLEWKIKKDITAKYGIFQLSANRGLNTPYANGYKGWTLAVSNQDGVVQALKLEYLYAQAPQAFPACVDQPLCSKRKAIENQLPKPLLQLGGYTAGWSFPYVDGSDRTASGTSGVFLHGIAPLRLPLGHGSSLWATAVANWNQDVNPVPVQLMGGLMTQGALPSRPFDVLSLAFSRANLSPYATFPSYLAGGAPQSYSAAAELGYIIKLNTRLSVQPGLQVLFQPSGNGDYKPAVLPALQFSLAL